MAYPEQSEPVNETLYDPKYSYYVDDTDGTLVRFEFGATESFVPCAKRWWKDSKGNPYMREICLGQGNMCLTRITDGVSVKVLLWILQLREKDLVNERVLRRKLKEELRQEVREEVRRELEQEIRQELEQKTRPSPF